MADKKRSAPRAKHADDEVIRMLADSNGVTYGPNNNPKRPGSRSEKEFKLYRDGMTVGEYIKAGGRRSGINWDEAKGFIALEKASAQKRAA